MNPSAAATWIGVALAMALAVVGASYFLMTGMVAAHENGTQRINDCVSNGGSWVSYGELCLQSGQEVK